MVRHPMHNRGKQTEPESIIQSKAIDLLTRLGFWVVRRGPLNNTQIGWEDGEPDLQIRDLCGGGYLECKKPSERNRLSDVQKLWHEKARKRGLRVAVFCSPEEALKIADRWRDEGGPRKVATVALGEIEAEFRKAGGV